MATCSFTSVRPSRGKLTARQERDCRLVARAVATATRVRYGDFFAASRLCIKTSDARQLAMYLCHTLLGLTMTEVGLFFGRDRTTVAHACGRIEDSRDDREADARIQALEDDIARDRQGVGRIGVEAGSGEAFHAGF